VRDVAILIAVIDEYAPNDAPATHKLFDVDAIEVILQTSAADGQALSYSELLLMLGYRFTRPKMRALCKVLDVIDQRAAAQGEPELAVLVVREGDRLPGQGWWVGRHDHQSAWTGPSAVAFIAALHAKAFWHWQKARIA
jgi:hypothetical protein